MKINPKVVDLSHWDRVTNLTEAYAAGYRGVIHKASHGRNVIDVTYPDRRRMAHAAGMLWGAYHFF